MTGVFCTGDSNTIANFEGLNFTGTTTTANIGFFCGDGQWKPVTDRMEIHGVLDAEYFSQKTIDALKNALGYGDVIVKCGWCGQYGARKTVCKHCGQAID